MGVENVFQDIAQRTGGDIYLGVVGPVRAGKSTFIKKLMDLLVIPNIVDDYDRQRTIDELPQSAAGRGIMTTEPKFIPNEAVDVEIKEGLNVRIRVVDCVGYTVAGAKGYEDEHGPRMVHTPWSDEPMPFQEAAEIGTKKVIADHSTLGVVVTTDGSITDIPREDYVEPEGRVVAELKELGRPFVIVLNTKTPDELETLEMAQAMELEYQVPVMAMDVSALDSEGITKILEEALYEFPVTEVTVNLPKWVTALPEDNWLRKQMEAAVGEAVEPVARLRDIDKAIEALSENAVVEDVMLENMDLGSGQAAIDVTVGEGLWYQVLREVTGFTVEGNEHILQILLDYAEIKPEYDQMAPALEQARETGYGVVNPILEDMTLEEPELIKQGGLFGVKLKASAPAISMFRTDINTEITPLMGTERQCADLARYITEKFQENPSLIWSYDIFGKSLQELVAEGISGKLTAMPENVQNKLKEAMKRIVNEGSGGIICIII
ncbi:MAG: stage IV sporulation protein A [Peptococcaceae bacterium]|nr:stage IV sporulation protein A [Peptococcaceae bacterium]